VTIIRYKVFCTNYSHIVFSVLESERSEFLSVFADATFVVCGNSSKWVFYGPTLVSSLRLTLTM
jgi:hypothetical protein